MPSTEAFGLAVAPCSFSLKRAGCSDAPGTSDFSAFGMRGVAAGAGFASADRCPFLVAPFSSREPKE